MNPFTSIPVKKLKKNKFKLDNTQYFNTGFGLLTPSLVLDCVPGDVHSIECAHLIRTEPFVSPTYGRIDVINDFYRVPYRILTDRKSYDQFFTGGVTGEVKLEFPYLAYSDIFKVIKTALSSLTEDQRYLFYSATLISGVTSSSRNLAWYGSLSGLDGLRYLFNLLDNLGYPVLNTFDDIFSLPEPFLASGTELPSGVEVYDAVAHSGTTYYFYVSDAYSSYKFNLLPLLAYIRIYNDNYIDQNLQADLFEYLNTIFDRTTFGLSFSEIFADLYENSTLFVDFCEGILYRSFRKNYYSSALPNTQRGSQVTVPLGEALSHTVTADAGLDFASGDQDVYLRRNALNNNVASLLAATPEEGETRVNLNIQMSPIAITAIRTALKLQQWLERNNIAGSRYFEHILAHFGVAPDDRSLQRSEYLGGNLTDLGISIVENTTMSSGSSPLGELAGRGTSNNYLKLKNVKCDEHCIIIGITTIMPRPIYTQSVSRFMFKRDKFDLFYEQFQHVGEQEVSSDEVFF